MTGAVARQRPLVAVKLLVEDLVDAIASYETHNAADADERQKPSPDVNTYLHHQTERAAARDRIVALTEALRAAARVIY